MKSCVFIGHREGVYDKKDCEKICRIVDELISCHQVMQFYVGGRGKFDNLCANIVSEMKEKYPQITLTKVLSYIPSDKAEDEKNKFDDSVYLLERNVPPRFAIIETNKLLIQKADFIISGVRFSFGGASKALRYAQRKKKEIFYIFPIDNEK